MQMFVRIVDELMCEAIGRVDFGFENAHYKQRFNTGFWREATVHLFSLTPNGRVLR
jgi:CelD/BcsL family acetyltransferase involved in cellulose biosynthesis